MALARHSLAAAAAVLCAPVGAVALAWRPDWRTGLGERLGALPHQPAGSIWLHGASVGESRLVGRMATALEARGHRPFATLQTVAGRRVLRDAQPALPCALAPLDHPWCVDRALARVRPAGLVLLETELWPVWIAACARSRVPVGVVSGRISDRAWPRYRRVAAWMRFALSRVSRVGARSARDAERFVALGVDPDRVDVTGDLKWAHATRRSEADEALRAVLHGRRVFVAGSTHPGEEQTVLEALRRAEQAGHAPVLVVAPRHLERADAVERALVAAGRTVRRRSRLGDAPLSVGEVLLLDTLGELRSLYGLACLAFVGGSFVPVGGHDPIEAAGQGCPVAIGPVHANVREAVAWLAEAGAVRVVADAAALGEALVEALAVPGGRPRFDPAALCAEGERVLARSVALVERLLDEGTA